MRIGLVVVLALSSAACGAQLDKMNRVALVASTLSIACDAAHTYRYAADDWPGGTWEANPVMGRYPSGGTVLGYFAGVAAVNAIIWAVAPRRYKSVVPTVVAAAQVRMIDVNYRNKGVICGVGGEVVQPRASAMSF